MLIPLATDRPLARPTTVTYALMAVNIGVHLAAFSLSRSNPTAAKALREFMVLQSDAGIPNWWEFLTYQFLHADWMHLLGNLLFLFVFGPAVEDRFRRVWFLPFYLVGGAFAGAAHLFFSEPIPTPFGPLGVPGVMGASGSIACVTGAYLVLFPLASVRVLVFFFVIGVYHIPAWTLIVFAIAKDVWSSAWSGGAGGVAFAAHLGGYFFGSAIAFLLLAARAIPREPYDLFSMGRQAHRRRVFKELASSGRSPWIADVPKAAAARDPGPDRNAEARASIAREVTAGNHDRAADLYISLLDTDPEAVLPRNTQYEIAGRLVAAKRHTHAAQAWDLFLKRYPADREANEVRLMLAFINARYLNDPVRAKALVAQARAAGLNEKQRAMAHDLETDLG